ncbi:MAG: hypothetical protein ACRBN8_43895 [Nannocystales bacterium]
MAISTCSHIEGYLQIQEEITTLQTLSCLRRVDDFFAIIATSLTDLSGLAGLESTGGFGLAENLQLVTVDVPSLQSTEEFYVYDNPSLTSLVVPSLVEVTYVEVFYNPLLPECEIEALLMQANPDQLFCDGNLPDMCAGLCG